MKTAKKHDMKSKAFRGRLKQTVLMFLLVVALPASGQNGFLYKILLSDGGTPLVHQNVMLDIAIKDNQNNVLYEETHSLTTDEHGMAAMEIGGGNVVSGQFDALDWSRPYSLSVSLSTDGGQHYRLAETSPLYFVPYAKFAASGGNVRRLNDLLDAKSDSDGTEDGSSLFVGMDAGLHDDGSDNRCIGIGYMNLYHNTTGQANISLGHQAMYANTTGHDNVAIGNAAMHEGDRANNNICIGTETMYAVTSGFSNVAIGYKSLRNNETGTENVAIGQGTMFANSGGHQSVAIGSGALNANTDQTATGNTAVGYRSMYTNTTGFANTALGYKAFYTGNDYSNSMALGNEAAVTASNQVRIGDYNVSSIGGYAAWSNVSDGRFKKDVRENVPGLALVMRLRPVTYHLDLEAIRGFLKNKGIPASGFNVDKAGELQTGFIAQEVERASQALHYDFHAVDKPKNDGDFYALRYAEFVPVLVRSIQEQQEIMEAQNRRIRDLEQKNRDLEARLQHLENELRNISQH